MFYEYISSKFISEALELKKAGKTVYVVTRNMVTPSYAELGYEKARREGVVFIHLEEDEKVDFSEGEARISGAGRELTLPVDAVIRSEDYGSFQGQGISFPVPFRAATQVVSDKMGTQEVSRGIHKASKRENGSREILGALGRDAPRCRRG